MLFELTGKNRPFLDLNLVQFASAYYVSKGELKRRKQEVIIRTVPNFSPNPSGQNYGKYCKYQLIKYKPWSGEVNTAWNGLEDSDDIHIQCYHAYLTLDNAGDYMPMLAQEQQQAQRYTDEEQDNDDDEDEEPQHEEEPEKWMLLCRLNQQYDRSVSQENPSQQNLHFDWTTAGWTMPPRLVRESANWITKRRN